jgi:NAD+ diphosphatase
MSFPFFDAPEREPSQFVGFAGNIIDRQSENRADDAAERALEEPGVKLLFLRGGRLFLKLDGGSFDPYFSRADAEAYKAVIEEAVLLGRAIHGPVVALPSALDPEDLPETVKAIDYRSVYMQGLVGAEMLGELAQAGALVAWHANHRFCGRCGHETLSRAGGYKRVCPNCEAQHFPRTDPVAIMLAVRGDKCVLGRSPHFAPGMFSCLAGFIEPGETIENAVRREVLEEAGIRIGRVAYHASQPWPFPYSLMIGCFGEALDEEIRHDTTELEACRWFSRREVRAALRGDEDSQIRIPPGGAIASHIIRAWAEN